jgi:hypothetical protein
MNSYKFKNIPTVYYLNSDSNLYLKEYTEKNLRNIGIIDYIRVSDFEFCPQRYDEWKFLLHNHEKIIPEIISEISLCALIIKTIKNWLETTNESMMIIMFDNVDYQYAQYLDFDWEYLMENIPHDWDSILLGFEDLLRVIPCFLHPVRISHGTGPTLINRRYAEKLVRLHFYDGKFNFFKKISNNFWKNDLNFVSYNYFLNQCGISYALPIFPKNCELVSDKYFSSDNLELTKKLYSIFWKKIKPEMSTEKFFSYSGEDDLYLSENVKNIKVFKKTGNHYHYEFK